MRFIVLFIATLLLVSCGPSDEDQLQDSAERAASWAATIRIVCSEREERHLPRRFVDVTFETALQQLDQVQQDVTKLEAPEQPRIASLTNELTAVVTHAQSGAGQDERTAGGDVSKLAQLERGLRAAKATP